MKKDKYVVVAYILLILTLLIYAYRYKAAELVFQGIFVSAIISAMLFLTWRFISSLRKA